MSSSVGLSERGGAPSAAGSGAGARIPLPPPAGPLGWARGPFASSPFPPWPAAGWRRPRGAS
eukprot:3683522-Alexandrium_andersonii.AAC.1